MRTRPTSTTATHEPTPQKFDGVSRIDGAGAAAGPAERGARYLYLWLPVGPVGAAVSAPLGVGVPPTARPVIEHRGPDARLFVASSL